MRLESEDEMKINRIRRWQRSRENVPTNHIVFDDVLWLYYSRIISVFFAVVRGVYLYGNDMGNPNFAPPTPDASYQEKANPSTKDMSMEMWNNYVDNFWDTIAFRK